VYYGSHMLEKNKKSLREHLTVKGKYPRHLGGTSESVDTRNRYRSGGANRGAGSLSV